MSDEESEPVFHPSSLIPHPSPAAILLAAGRSRRMGAFKPLLPFGDRTVIESCISNLREAGVESIVVVVGHHGERIRERLAHLPVHFAVNTDAGSEMGASIAAGLEQIPDSVEALLIALCDQPAVPADVIRRLIDEQRRAGARLVVPEYDGRGGHPVLLDLNLRRELLNLNSQSGLRGLFEAHRDEVRRVQVASAYVARDMDTWEDYLALHEEVFGAPPAVTEEQRES